MHTMFEKWFNDSRGEPKPKHRNETLEERQYREYYEDSLDGYTAGYKQGKKDEKKRILNGLKKLEGE